MTPTRSRQPLVFVLPPGSAEPSGGNVYNRELSRALAELVPVTLTTFAQADVALRTGKHGVFLFDTLELEATGALGPSAPGQVRLLVVHHLPSLEPSVRFDASDLARENEALARFDGFVATSDFTRELLVARGHTERGILTVPPAASPSASAIRIYAPPLSALLVANVIPRKGVLELFEALADVVRGELALSLRIVGGIGMAPAYVERCHRTLARSPALSAAVRFGGPVPYELMGATYDAAHVLVSASSMETFGMAIYEARAHGLPVLALDGGYVRHHFTDGENGVLCRTPHELAATLCELSEDERRMRALFDAAQGSRISAPYGWPEAAKRFLAELERVGL
ncbi:MAG TPA: glycosyltransferase family 4 protein [Polyangiaceae bacterium]